MYAILTYIWLIFLATVTAGKYTTQYMDVLDNDNDQIYFSCDIYDPTICCSAEFC